MKTYVSWCINRASHDDDFFDSQERLWVFRCGDGEIRQGTNRYNCHCIRLVLSENVQHDLMSGLQRRCEKLMLFFDGLKSCNILCGHVFRLGHEEGLPCLFGRKVGVLNVLDRGEARKLRWNSHCGVCRRAHPHRLYTVRSWGTSGIVKSYGRSRPPSYAPPKAPRHRQQLCNNSLVHESSQISFEFVPIGFLASSVSKPAGLPFCFRHARSFSMWWNRVTTFLRQLSSRIHQLDLIGTG